MRLNRINKALLPLGCVAVLTYGIYLDYHAQDYARQIKSVPQVQIDSISGYSSYSRMPIVKNFKELPDSTQQMIQNYEDKGYSQIRLGIVLGFASLSILGLYYLARQKE